MKIQAKGGIVRIFSVKRDRAWGLLFNSLRLYNWANQYCISACDLYSESIRFTSRCSKSKIFTARLLQGDAENHWNSCRSVPPHSIPYSHPLYPTYNAAVGKPTDPYTNLNFWKSPVIFPHYTNINEEILTWIESFTAGPFSLEQMAQKQPR
jgi:hypothetical protein